MRSFLVLMFSISAFTASAQQTNEATFSWISQHVLSQCVQCHAGAQNHTFVTSAWARALPATNSPLCVMPNSHDMPPAAQANPQAAVTPDEMKAIVAWINTGAQNN